MNILLGIVTRASASETVGSADSATAAIVTTINTSDTVGSSDTVGAALNALAVTVSDISGTSEYTNIYAGGVASLAVNVSDITAAGLTINPTVVIGGGSETITPSPVAAATQAVGIFLGGRRDYSYLWKRIIRS